jgi:hypothetical protein
MNVDWQAILQYVLVWQALGVEHFYIYVQEVSPEVDMVLKIFESENLVERIPRSAMPPTLGDYIDVNMQVMSVSQKRWRRVAVAFYVQMCMFWVLNKIFID